MAVTLCLALACAWLDPWGSPGHGGFSLFGVGDAPDAGDVALGGGGLVGGGDEGELGANRAHGSTDGRDEDLDLVLVQHVGDTGDVVVVHGDNFSTDLLLLRLGRLDISQNQDLDRVKI